MSGKIRIIGGQWRGRKLPVADVPGLRPTGDRARETLFNWLGPRTIGARCLDLFAGTGALGLEAASRGAAEVVLVERDRQLTQALRAIAGEWPGGQVLKVEHADALQWLNERQGTFDLVFVDPPFGLDMQSVALTRLASTILGPDSLVYVENDSEQGAELAPDIAATYEDVRNRRQGRVMLRLLRLRKDRPVTV